MSSAFKNVLKVFQIILLVQLQPAGESLNTQAYNGRWINSYMLTNQVCIDWGISANERRSLAFLSVDYLSFTGTMCFKQHVYFHLIQPKLRRSCLHVTDRNLWAWERARDRGEMDRGWGKSSGYNPGEGWRQNLERKTWSAVSVCCFYLCSLPSVCCSLPLIKSNDYPKSFNYLLQVF